MARRTIRITRKITVRRRIEVTQTTRFVPSRVSLPPPRVVSRQVISSPFAGIRQAAAEYTEAEQGVPDADKQHDVFIAHASEDQAGFVSPLAELLRADGLEVWYSKWVLGIGTRLRRTIDAGLANSRFGVVVLSPAFFVKQWPNRELDGFVSRTVVEDRQLILPIWHNVTHAQVVKFSPTLADSVALVSATKALPEIAREIAAAVRSYDPLIARAGGPKPPARPLRSPVRHP